ncbi:MAG: hypothetical protein QM730_13930 [Anaerolineales bacterium]
MLQTVPDQKLTLLRALSTFNNSLSQKQQEATGKINLLETDGNMGLF